MERILDGISRLCSQLPADIEEQVRSLKQQAKELILALLRLAPDRRGEALRLTGELTSETEPNVLISNNLVLRCHVAHRVLAVG